MPRRKPADRFTVALAIDALKESVEATRKAEAHLAEKKAERNDRIRSALDYVPYTTLMRETGLSRETLSRIAHSE